MPRIGLVPLAALVLAACDGGGSALVPPAPTPTPTPSPSPAPSPSPTPAPTTIAFSFDANLGGWLADYADYPQGDEADIGFIAEHAPLPSPFAPRRGYRLRSRNESDDVFMFAFRPVTGLVPGRRYRVDIALQIATNAPPGCPGAGGSPGESVYVKAGATPQLPARTLENGWVRVNFDKGNQAMEGAHAINLGNVATLEAGSCSGANPWRLKTLARPGAGPRVTADAQGRLWPVIGTDSGFESVTEVYLLDGTLTLTPD